mgnify:CR=1 FL=1
MPPWPRGGATVTRDPGNGVFSGSAEGRFPRSLRSLRVCFRRSHRGNGRGNARGNFPSLSPDSLGRSLRAPSPRLSTESDDDGGDGAGRAVGGPGRGHRGARRGHGRSGGVGAAPAAWCGRALGRLHQAARSTTSLGRGMSRCSGRSTVSRLPRSRQACPRSTCRRAGAVFCGHPFGPIPGVPNRIQCI